MIFNLKPCHVLGCLADHDGVVTASARCEVHDWEVIDTFERGDGQAVRWSLAEGDKHEALFRRIAVARARAQVALDEELQRRLTSFSTWEGEKFDGNFLDGVISIQFELPLDEEETDG